MFNKKYTDELLKEKVDKLSQLDKIEFNQRDINENIGDSKNMIPLYSQAIIIWILSTLAVNFTMKSKVFYMVELYDLSKLYSLGNLICVAFILLFSVVIVLSIIPILKRRKEFEEENEQFLKERLKK